MTYELGKPIDAVVAFIVNSAGKPIWAKAYINRTPKQAVGHARSAASCSATSRKMTLGEIVRIVVQDGGGTVLWNKPYKAVTRAWDRHQWVHGVEEVEETP